MFDGSYFERNSKCIKGIVDFYGHKFFYMKTVLDLGCGYADMSGTLYRLGAAVTAVDARPEHLKIVSKKFSGIKTVQANLDGQWPLPRQKFDLVLDLGVLCHLADYEKHLKDVCAVATHLVLETAVCDSDNMTQCISVEENKGMYDLSYSGRGCRPSPAAIERVLRECGMNFKRVDSSKYNTSEYKYDWGPRNDDSTNIYKRRIWFAVKANHGVQFANPQSEIAPSPVIITDWAGNEKQIATTVSPKPPYTRGTSAYGLITIEKSPIHGPDTFNQPITINPSTATIINPAPLLSYKGTDKKFVIVIPSYNNIRWCEQNIRSALDQNYTNFRVIFTDDKSSDGTFDKVCSVVNASGKVERATLIKNDVRVGALENLYNMIYSCDDDEIILTVDGDDWLANTEVLNRLNQVYSREDVWMTCGQYQNSTDHRRGCADQYPQHVIDRNSYRQDTWRASHLRTFYTWLFKKINRNDLMYDGKFAQMTWDFCIMFPMLEMSGSHHKYIPDILYIYNRDNPLNDDKVNAGLQQRLDKYFRSLPKYGKTEKPGPETKKVGLLLIATGKYHRFIQGLISSADKHFLNGKDVTYYVFSDAIPRVRSKRPVVHIQTEHKPFPFASMDRFKHFTKNAGLLSRENYLYYVDVDCLFVDNVGDEIIGDLVGVRHCGFVNRPGPVETNPRSCLYAELGRYKFYYGGGFSGGKKTNYLALAKWCYDQIEQDVSNGIVPIWHDETALNRYFLDHEPTITLNSSYHYPQSNIEMYKGIWGNEKYQPKILLLDKSHHEIRQ